MSSQPEMWHIMGKFEFTAVINRTPFVIQVNNVDHNTGLLGSAGRRSVYQYILYRLARKQRVKIDRYQVPISILNLQQLPSFLITHETYVQIWVGGMYSCRKQVQWYTYKATAAATVVFLHRPYLGIMVTSATAALKNGFGRGGVHCSSPFPRSASSHSHSTRRGRHAIMRSPRSVGDRPSCRMRFPRRRRRIVMFSYRPRSKVLPLWIFFSA